MYKEIQDPTALVIHAQLRHTHNIKMILWSFVVTSYEFVFIVLLVGRSVVVCLRIKKEKNCTSCLPDTRNTVKRV